MAWYLDGCIPLLSFSAFLGAQMATPFPSEELKRDTCWVEVGKGGMAKE